MLKLRPALLALTFVLVTIGAATAQTVDNPSGNAPQPPASTTQKWQAGWDNFGEPLNFTSSNIMWSLSAARKLTVTFNLVGATPNKLYQVGIHLFCDTPPAAFGQFFVTSNGSSCIQLTRQNVTKKVAAVEFGVVLADTHGKGSFKVVVGPIASGTYDFEFTARDGAGCELLGGGGNGSDCFIDFQSPGPFGTVNTIVVP